VLPLLELLTSITGLYRYFHSPASHTISCFIARTLVTDLHFSLTSSPILSLFRGSPRVLVRYHIAIHLSHLDAHDRTLFSLVDLHSGSALCLVGVSLLYHSYLSPPRVFSSHFSTSPVRCAKASAYHLAHRSVLSPSGASVGPSLRHTRFPYHIPFSFFGYLFHIFFLLYTLSPLNFVLLHRLGHVLFLVWAPRLICHRLRHPLTQSIACLVLLLSSAPEQFFMQFQIPFAVPPSSSLINSRCWDRYG